MKTAGSIARARATFLHSLGRLPPMLKGSKDPKQTMIGEQANRRTSAGCSAYETDDEKHRLVARSASRCASC